MAGTWNKVQVVAGNNGAVAATSITLTIAASGLGNTLLAFIMTSVAGQTITPPAGWTQVKSTSTNPVAGTFVSFINNNCPAGITTVVFNLSGAALAAGGIYEISAGYNLLSPIDTSDGFNNPNGTGYGVSNKPTKELNEAAFGAIGYINNTAIAAASVPTGYTNDANSISTNAAGNAGIIVMSNMDVGNSIVTFGGLLASTPTDGPSTLFMALLFTLVAANNGYAGPTNFIVAKLLV